MVYQPIIFPCPGIDDRLIHFKANLKGKAKSKKALDDRLFFIEPMVFDVILDEIWDEIANGFICPNTPTDI